MSSALRRLIARVTRAEEGITLPAMDGPLRPNTRLDMAAPVVELPNPDNLVAAGDAILATSGRRVIEIREGRAAPFLRGEFDADIVSLAFHPEGGLAVGLADGRIVLRGGRHGDRTIATLAGRPLVCPTALAFDGDDLVVAQGSAIHGPSDWQVDLMCGGTTGSVWRIPRADEAAALRLAQDLAYPNGLLLDSQGTLIVSESWRHRLIRIEATRPSPATVVLEQLPGYPARLAAASRGGAWLAVFAPRSQLVEHVLREPAYRTRMMAEIEDRNCWVAPTLRAGRHLMEPLQSGAARQMGNLKPWAPARSYGLVVRLGSDLQPLDSLHSRADGDRHGTTSCLEGNGRLLVTCKGDDIVVVADIGEPGGAPADAA